MGLVFLLCHCTEKEQRPNFLFILTDDQAYYTIAALGNTDIETPNTDKLVESGITFTNCFNQGSWIGAVCVASRTMLNTGQSLYRAPRNKSYLDQWAQLKKPDDDYIPTEVPTWAETFSKNGYETFITGKWHNSSYAAIKGFDIGKAIGAGMYYSVDKNGSRRFAYKRPAKGNTWSPWNKELKGHWSPEVWDIVTNE